jgi:small ligand-binding sensory domain FIST
MGVRIGAGLSTNSDVRTGAIEAAAQAGRDLPTGPPDLVVVFASGAHVVDPEATLEGVHEALAPGALVGCGAAGVLGCGREVEEGTAVAVWAARLGDGVATPFHASVREHEEGVLIEGLPPLEGAAAAIMLSDPFSFPVEPLLPMLTRAAPGVPVIGGLASAQVGEGETVLFLDSDVHRSGAVGVRLDGVEMLPLVSQGAAPIGPELTITAAHGNVIEELAGQPALAKLRQVVEDLDERERGLTAHGLLVGLVIDGGKPDYGPGDFLVRGLMGADTGDGSLAVAAPVETGQVVQLHTRDAESADRELREALDLHVEALGGSAPAGALMFTCNGRGRGMFTVPDHDARALDEGLRGAPAAGFFAAGEIGPVGAGSFVHGFTATVAVFAA